MGRMQIAVLPWLGTRLFRRQASCDSLPDDVERTGSMEQQVFLIRLVVIRLDEIGVA
jgi:hypothetical protein